MTFNEWALQYYVVDLYQRLRRKKAYHCVQIVLSDLDVYWSCGWKLHAAEVKYLLMIMAKWNETLKLRPVLSFCDGLIFIKRERTMKTKKMKHFQTACSLYTVLRIQTRCLRGPLIPLPEYIDSVFVKNKLVLENMGLWIRARDRLSQNHIFESKIFEGKKYYKKGSCCCWIRDAGSGIKSRICNTGNHLTP